jgi:hypothetical protein
MANNIILTKGEEVTGNFSNFDKMLISKGIVEGHKNYWHYKRKKFPFILEETGEKVWKLPRL